MGGALVTAVVGAGPAGLLFCGAARIMFERRGGDPGAWPVYLFDKRSEYRRTHRLRIDRRPLLALQADLDDPRFDELIAFLEACDYAPAANRLEERLATTVARLGIVRERLHVGSGDGQVPLASLRARLEEQGRLEPSTPFTIVGADSVHSAVRDAVRGDRPGIEHTHQTVARIQVAGDGLPDRLGAVDQYRVSKVLGSIVDYRWNPNGFAEVDVFLPAAQHRSLEALGAEPAAPVSLTPEVVRELAAPLFERLVEHLRSGLTSSPAEVRLHSTFRLEHRYVERVAYEHPAARATVFLVGDAAVSLPFFRGMACLVKCVHSLARAHCDLAGGADPAAAAARYDEEVGAIRSAEVAAVEARARLVRGAREFARVSSLLPFPLQTWFLSIPDSKRAPGRVSAGLALNVLAALAAGAFAVGGAMLEPALGWWAALLQAGGGLAYRAAQQLEPGPDTLLRRVWLTQIVMLFVVGAAVTATSSMDAGRITDVMPALLWLLLGYAFVAGMLVYDALGRRWLGRALLESDDG